MPSAVPSAVPSAICESGISKKRKRTVVEKAVSPPSTIHDANEVLELENQILESRRHYNNIARLLEYLKKPDAEDDEQSFIAAVSLCRVFCRLLAGGKMSKNQGLSKDETLIIDWLRERLKEYKNLLIPKLASQKSEWSQLALTLPLQLMKEEAVCLKVANDTAWRIGTFALLLRKLADGTTPDATRGLFVKNYLVEFDDIRYYTFVGLIELGSKDMSSTSLDIAISILVAVENVPAKRDDIKNLYITPTVKTKYGLYSPDAHKKRAQEAWMSILRHDLSKAQRKTILDLMTPRIAPWFQEVALLSDFLTDSFNFGGSFSLLALSGLFYLIQKKNLDYPQFYPKLYSMLDSDILHSKHRSRFFRLLNVFLASTHLPAALVASFIKKLSRLALHAPPSGIVVVVPWIYNLLKNHPTCTFMLQRKLPNAEEFLAPYVNTWGDPFCMEESDPMKTGALESSLWEIQTLQSHYHPNVATISKIISEQFTKQTYNIEDFLDHSYGSMLDAELSKDIKKSPEIEYEIPKKIFFKHDAESGRPDNFLVQLWDFS